MAWTDPPAFTADDLTSTQFNTYLRDNLLAQGQAQPHIWIDPTFPDDSSQPEDWTIQTDVSTPNDPYGYGFLHGHVDDWVEYHRYLTPGRWVMNIHTAKRNDYGTLFVEVFGPDDVELEPGDPGVAESSPTGIGEFNCYQTGGTAEFQLADPIEFTITDAGIHRIRCTIGLKDIHSSGNTIRIFAIYLQKFEDDPPHIWTTPRTWTTEYVRAAVLETHLRQNLRASGCAQTREYIDPFTWAQVSGVTFDHGDVFPLGIAARWDTQNEWGEWDVVLPAGDVSVTLIGEKNTDNGIATVRWDGVDRGTTDFYASSLSQNNRGTVSWTNSTTKKARLRITNATKNASSTGYDLAINRIVITYDNSGWTDPGHFAARTLVSVDDFNDNWRAQMQMRGEMPWVIDIDPLAPAIDNQGWSTYNKDDTFDYFVALSTDDSHLPGYDGFWVEWDVALAAGTYECSVIGSQGTTRGQMDVLLDGTAVVSNAEFYHASQTDSETRTTTGITVATTKVYRVRVRINSKNASASFFQGRLSRVRFRRTA